MALPVRAFPWARVPFGAAVLATACELALVLRGSVVPWWALAATALALVGAVGLGVFVQAAGMFARPILAADGAAGRVALTFDDGPDDEATRALLDLLDARGHRATFFVIGRRAAERRALVDEIVRRGHALGNHSYAHARSSPFWSVARLRADLDQASALLRSAGAPTRWYRAPIGIVSPPVAAAARAAGLTLVGWTATARDGVAGTDADAALRRLRGACRAGAILVLHDAAERDDRRPIAPEVLPRLLDELEAQGLRSVTLDEMFKS